MRSGDTSCEVTRSHASEGPRPTAPGSPFSRPPPTAAKSTSRSCRKQTAPGVPSRAPGGRPRPTSHVQLNVDASPQIIVPGGSSAKSASVWEADGLSRARVTAHARHTGGAVTRVGARASLRHLGGFECVHAGPSHAPRRRSASESCFLINRASQCLKRFSQSLCRGNG